MLNETVYPIIQLEVVPGMYSDPAELKFNWSLIDFKQTELLIKLDFANRPYVSSNVPFDKFKVTIYGLDYFVDVSGNYI